MISTIFCPVARRTHRVTWLWKYRHFCRKLACDSVWSTLHHIHFCPLSPIIDAMRRILLQTKCHKSCRSSRMGIRYATSRGNPCWYSRLPTLNVRIFAFQSNQKQLVSTQITGNTWLISSLEIYHLRLWEWVWIFFQCLRKNLKIDMYLFLENIKTYPDDNLRLLSR